MRPRSILMVAATPFFSDRGCHIRILHEMRHLAASGIAVRLATYRLGKDMPGLAIERSVGVPWYRKVSPGPSWHKLYLDPLLALTVARSCLRNRPDVIHAHLYEGLVAAWVARAISRAFFWRSRGARAPIVFDCQGGLAAEMYEYTLKRYPFARLWYGLFSIVERITLMMPDAIVCSSARSAELLEKSFGAAKGRIRVVPDGYSDLGPAGPLFEQDPRSRAELRRTARARLGVPEGDAVIMYLGSMVSAKGVDKLLDAVPSISSARPRATFVFGGFGDLVDAYRERYADLVARKKVIFAGRVSYEDAPALLVAADLAVDPKRDSSESSGKLMDSIAAGVPAVCFDPRMADAPGVSCIRDFDEIPAALDRALAAAKNDSPEPIGRARSTDDPYSWSVIVQDLMAVYDAALAMPVRAKLGKKAWAYIFGAAIAAVFALLFFRFSSPGAVFHAMASADPALLSASLLIYAAIYALRAVRFARVSPVKGFIDNAILVSFHVFFGAVLPARIGEASYPVLIKKMHGVSYAKSISDLAHVRVLDGLNVLLVAPVMIGYCAGAFGLASSIALLLAGESLIAGAILIAGRFARLLPKGFGAHAVADWRTLGATSALSLVLSVCMMAFGAVLMSAFHVAAPATALIAGSALALVAGASPIQGLFGIGGIEAGWIVPLRAFGATAGASFAAGASYHIVNLSFTSLFALLALAASSIRRRRHNRPDR